MRLETESYERIIEALHDGLYLVDRDRRITYWNKAAERISGFTADEVVGTFCSDNILTHVDSEGRSLCCSMCPLAATMADRTPREAQVYLHHKNGHRIPVSVRVTTLTDAANNVTGGVELFTDLSNQAATELRVREIEKLALLDNLTQLANRHYLGRELQARFEEMRRYAVAFGVLIFDIDNFKAFNDTYGHLVGDKILTLVARTIEANARPFDLYGRWGGEEFLGIVRNIDASALAAIGGRTLKLIEESYLSHGDGRIGATVSIGGTLAGENDDTETLLTRADECLYQSKAAGKNRLTLG